MPSNAKLLSLLLAAPATAEILFATSYNDHAVTSLNLQGSSLSVISKNLDCGSEPTFLTLDYAKSILYCLNEGWGGSSSLTSYKTSPSGQLETIKVLPVLKSPVSSTLYGANRTKLAVAHYDTSAFSTFSVADAGAGLAQLSQQTYTLPSPATVPERQDAPHLHDAVLDPTGKFILVPDLGSDLVRVYQVGANDAVTEVSPIKAVAGSGPRHAAFAKAGRKTFLYTLNELSNTITGYTVTYAKNNKAPTFQRIFDFSSHGPGGSVPAGTKAAEIRVSPDNKFVIVSSRGENTLTIPNTFDASNPATTLPSDPLISFKINAESGALTLVQTAPAGGRNPRGFSLNKKGNLVASALQDDNRVVIIERNVRTGLLGKIVAHATVGEGANNGPNYAVFNE